MNLKDAIKEHLKLRSISFTDEQIVDNDCLPTLLRKET